MEYLKTIRVADLNDRIRLDCLINENNAFVMPSIVVYADNYTTELFSADNDFWIKEILLLN